MSEKERFYWTIPILLMNSKDTADNLTCVQIQIANNRARSRIIVRCERSDDVDRSCGAPRRDRSICV
jgi:hypothetical protein